MEISTLKQFEEFLQSRIPKKEDVFGGEIGLKRAKYFMRLLGNPQNKIRVIHIAGTSGKGSTVHLISKLLESQGFRVGLSVSPHVFDIRERMQINNKLPHKKLILKYFNEILPIIGKMEKCRYGAPTFFEINVGLAFYMFAKEKLDYAVIETGLGGKLDATNCVTNKNKVAILTKIGLDHMKILGNTVSKIAKNKCEIIRNKNTVISIEQPSAIRDAIRKKCSETNSILHIIKSKHNCSFFSTSPKKTTFDFNFSDILLRKINLGLIGLHQAENCSLALACLSLLSKRDKFSINEESLRKTLKKVSIPGRFEIRKIKRNTAIIDGAHNPQKMDAFIKNLSAIFPKQKFIFIIAFKKGKDYKTMLEKIIPLADKIFLTHFSTKNMNNNWNSVDNRKISDYLSFKEYTNFKIIGNKKSDIQKAIQTSKKPVVITGSLYLIGSIYKFLK